MALTEEIEMTALPTLNQIRRMPTQELIKLADTGDEWALDELAERGADSSYLRDEQHQ